jgi:transcription elongation factor GreA
MQTDTGTRTGEAALDEALRAAVGYRVLAPEGDVGVVTRVPEAGEPSRPLVLVVRDGKTFRFVPRALVQRVVPGERRVVVASGWGRRPMVGVPLPAHARSHPDVRREEPIVGATAEERVLITAEGYERRRSELDRLQTDERVRLRDLLREAREDGVLDDNPMLVDLLAEQEQLERRIALLEAQLAAAAIAPPATDGRAAVGSRVRVRDKRTAEVFQYELVGPIEGDPETGRVSVAAPIGRALIGREPGAVVDVVAPCGAVTLEVLEVGAAASARKAA